MIRRIDTGIDAYLWTFLNLKLSIWSFQKREKIFSAAIKILDQPKTIANWCSWGSIDFQMDFKGCFWRSNSYHEMRLHANDKLNALLWSVSIFFEMPKRFPDIHCDSRNCFSESSLNSKSRPLQERTCESSRFENCVVCQRDAHQINFGLRW